jgi:PIN domain nuclease of toxin-antitoxin system
VVGLLDTSTLVWTLATPERLSGRAKELIAARDIVLSVASYWEIVIKTRKGLLELIDPVTWWARAVDLLGVPILAIRPAHVTALWSLPDIHKDPFDRILIAQAGAEGLSLVTSDARIAAYPIPTLW